MGMLYKHGEVFWIKRQSTERPIRQSSGTTKKWRHIACYLKEKVERTGVGLPIYKTPHSKWLAGTIWAQWSTPRLTLPP